MRKHICFVLSAVMLLCAVVGASPAITADSESEGAIYQMPDADVNDNPYAQQYEIVFAPVRGTFSEEEIGLMHLRASKMPDYIIDSFTDEEIAEFAKATKAVISVSYYTETFDEVSGESSMVNISYEDFQQLELVDAGEEEYYLPALIQSEMEQGAETTPTKGSYN